MEEDPVPCKDFFAIFSANLEWSVDSLPDHYRNSVFITLDNGHTEIKNSLKDAVKIVDAFFEVTNNMEVNLDKCENLLHLDINSSPNLKESNSDGLSEESLERQVS